VCTIAYHEGEEVTDCEHSVVLLKLLIKARKLNYIYEDMRYRNQMFDVLRWQLIETLGLDELRKKEK
jgi:hypothetical protein